MAQKNRGIRWRQDDKRLLDNMMKKVFRKAKKYGLEAGQFPHEYKSQIKTRKEYNQAIKRMARFLKPGAEEKVQIGNSDKSVTKFQLKEITINLQKINRMRKKELIELNPSTERGTMGIVREQNLKPKVMPNIKTVSTSNWEKFVESVEKQADKEYLETKRQRFYDNYKQSLRTAYGEDAKELEELLGKLDADELVMLYYQDPIFTASFQYEKADQDLHFRITKERLTNYVNSKNT